MADLVSWLLIEPGWRVSAADGEEVGRVEAVTGDSNADIFDGLSIASGLFARPKYVPAEQVAEITEGHVRLSLDRAAIDSLGEYEVPPESADIESERASRTSRLDESLVHPDPHEHRVGLLRRVLSYLGLADRR
jgi:hypothetical protein